MKAKERTAIPRVEMNELDAKYRSHSRKEEVNQGLTAEQAITESNVVSTVQTQDVWKVVR